MTQENREGKPERMVTSMEALLLSQEVRIKKEMREKVEGMRESRHDARTSYGIGYEKALDDLLTYLK